MGANLGKLEILSDRQNRVPRLWFGMGLSRWLEALKSPEHVQTSKVVSSVVGTNCAFNGSSLELTPPFAAYFVGVDALSHEISMCPTNNLVRNTYDGMTVTKEDTQILSFFIIFEYPHGAEERGAHNYVLGFGHGKPVLNATA